ncbi:MAG TPA: DoxX family protein [Kofleriaceae bacterium]|nr:DoxX family protein [Kofleriaceae bacterium]
MQPSIAERFFFGRPYHPVAGDTVVPVVPRSGTALLGRILIAAIFLISGIAKLTDPAGTIGYMHQAGISHADTLVYVAGIAELAGGLGILFGFLTRLAALGLFVFLAIVQPYFHKFWGLPAEEAKNAMVQFFKDLSLMGGLLMLVAMGPGRYSLDAKMRRRAA